MKTTPMALCLAASGALLLCGCGAERDAQGSAKKSGRIRFRETEHDFGTIPAGKPVVHVFEFENLGPGELTLNDPRSSCGCTAALLSAKTIPVHGKGKVRVEFNAAGRGSFHKTVVVTGSAGRVELTIRGDLMNVLMWKPSVLDFGQVLLGTTRTKETTVFVMKGLKFGGLRVVGAPEFCRAEIVPTDQPRRYRLRVALKADTPPGTISGRIRLDPQVADAHEPADFAVPLAGMVIHFATDPVRLDFGRLRLGQAVRRTVRLRAADAVDLEDLEVYVSSDRLSARTERGSDPKQWRIFVAVNPRGELGKFSETVWPVARLPNGEQARGHSIHVAGQIEAEFDIYPKRVHFGAGLPGQERIKTIKLTADASFIPDLKILGTDQVRTELAGTGRNREIRIIWQPKGRPGRVAGFLEVGTNGQATTVPISAYVLPRVMAGTRP